MSPRDAKPVHSFPNLLTTSPSGSPPPAPESQALREGPRPQTLIPLGSEGPGLTVGAAWVPAGGGGAGRRCSDGGGGTGPGARL